MARWRIKVVFHPLERVADLPDRQAAIEYGKRMHEISDCPAGRVEVSEIHEAPPADLKGPADE